MSPSHGSIPRIDRPDNELGGWRLCRDGSGVKEEVRSELTQPRRLDPCRVRDSAANLPPEVESTRIKQSNM